MSVSVLILTVKQKKLNLQFYGTKRFIFFCMENIIFTWGHLVLFRIEHRLSKTDFFVLTPLSTQFKLLSPVWVRDVNWAWNPTLFLLHNIMHWNVLWSCRSKRTHSTTWMAHFWNNKWFETPWGFFFNTSAFSNT